MSYNSKNQDVLNFNNILKKHCLENNIRYFDTIDVCSRNKEGVELYDEYIGKDQHYKGAEYETVYNIQIKKNEYYGLKTHITFLNMLISSLI